MKIVLWAALYIGAVWFLVRFLSVCSEKEDEEE